MKAKCPVCPRGCVLEEGQTGFCRARANIGGRVAAKNYGKITAMALDPIEKKPLARFHPGGWILSVSSYGCNLACPFCQNSDISMAGDEIDAVYMPPEALAQKALLLSKRAPGNLGVAYTYNEPLVGYEYVRDTARLVHEAGLLNVLVTNGTVCEAPLMELLPLFDAMNIDLKSFSQRGYDALGGYFETVKRTIALSAEACHVEVTTLVVPGLSDGGDDMAQEAAWLASIDPDMPLHISRFFPRYHMAGEAPTPVETVRRLAGVAREHLKHVYTGNC